MDIINNEEWTARAGIDEPAGLQKERAQFLKKEFVEIHSSAILWDDHEEDPELVFLVFLPAVVGL